MGPIVQKMDEANEGWRCVVALLCFIHPYAQGERKILVDGVIVGAKVRDVSFAGSNICVDDLGQNVKSLMFGLPSGEGIVTFATSCPFSSSCASRSALPSLLVFMRMWPSS